MTPRCVCLLALAAVLLLIFATVSRSNGLRGEELQGPSRIPSQFSEQERVVMKVALKGAIQIPTVSFSHEESNTTALAEFGEYIRKVFPTVFNTSFIQHEVVGNYSHLFTIQGSDSSLQPYMLLAHFDVVPAPEEGWKVPPFSGLERDGFIHGRGTLDNKNSVMAILQALELLLIRNYIPRRSFFIALGHDEEVSGTNGALKISALLQARGVRLAFLVDEGSFILDGIIPNLKKPFAIVDFSKQHEADLAPQTTMQMDLCAYGIIQGRMKSGGPSLILFYRISVSEKGALDLMLQVNMTPGHSSAPPKETSIGILSAAVSRLEQTPMPNMFGAGTLKMILQQLANEFPFPTNIILSNLWLFQPLVSRLMERSPITNALVRTTTALTMFNAGVKVNVIPPVAQATINFRIHPAQTVHEVCAICSKQQVWNNIKEVLEFVKNVVADDRVQLHVLRAFDPLPFSPSVDQALGYQLLRQTIHSIFPEVNIVVPGICIGNTDSRHYSSLTNGIYLFNPIYLQLQDFNSLHGINEKISVQAYETQVKFMFELIQNADTVRPSVLHVHEL